MAAIGITHNAEGEGGRNVELDIWLPDHNLGFEYQGNSTRLFLTDSFRGAALPQHVRCFWKLWHSVS